MAYSVTCVCGATAPVAASQAGTHVQCRCGESIAVPTLSALRAKCVELGAETSALERVRRLLASGKLPAPAGAPCPLTRKPASVIVSFHVQCESPSAYGSESSQLEAVIMAIMTGWTAVLSSRRSDENDVCGNEVSIELPVRLSTDAVRQLDRPWRQRPLRRLLANTPAYRDLFKEYPRARISQR